MNLLKIKGIEFSFPLDGNHYQLTVENPEIMSSLFQDFYELNEERIFLSQDYKLLDLKKNMLFIPSIFDIDINSKKCLSTLYQNLEQTESTVERREHIQKINHLISELMEILRTDLCFSIDYEENLKLNDYLSLVQMKVVNSEKDLLERITVYLRIIYQMYPCKLVIFPFLDSFLSVDHLIQLMDEMKLLGMSLIIFNSSQNQNLPQKKILIDYDLCEI